jgi:hypothetical protein
VIGVVDAPRFSHLFDRALAACAEAQRLAARCGESQARARATHASARRIQALAGATRTAWAERSVMFAALRREVEIVAWAMRTGGTDRTHAGAAVRAHMRFVLYDGGLREQEAELLIVRASEWVDVVYAAA